MCESHHVMITHPGPSALIVLSEQQLDAALHPTHTLGRPALNTHQRQAAHTRDKQHLIFLPICLPHPFTPLRAPVVTR